MTTVFHLITRFLDGGAEVTTTNTIEALRDAPEPYKIKLGFGASYDLDEIQEIEDLGAETRCFSTLRHYNPVTQIAAVGHIALYLSREEVDIVHTHSTEAGIVGRFAARIAGVPVVIHEIHGDPITADRSDVFNWCIQLLERTAANCTTVQIVKSKRIKNEFLNRDIGTPEQYRTIYHGVEIDEYANASPTDIPPRRYEHRLLFVGRLVEGKGLQDLLDAVVGLEQCHDFELLIVGNGPLAPRLADEIAARDLNECVSLLGYRSDVSELLASADIFVLPSYREGTPRVITEALASGVPVVATNIAGIPEQVNDGVNGLLFEPGDINALTGHLNSLLGDAGSRKMFAENTGQSLEKYRLESVQGQYQDLYRELVANHIAAE